MSVAASLMQALMGPGTEEAVANDALHEALECEIDPLHWCAARLGLSDAEIMRRAAAWGGLPFFDTVPRAARPARTNIRLDALREVRLYRLRLRDREVAFASPDFFGVLRLARACSLQPALRRGVCLVSGPALRNFLVDSAAQDLLDGARQTLVRHWPHATAELDLTIPVRCAFVAILLIMAAAIVCAPLLGQVWLAPLWIGLVLVPSLLRLAALALAPSPKRPTLPARDDAALPLYTILVPLRGEANMVAQLCTALGKLDYPVEKLEIIFVVESRSPTTVQAVRRHLRDPRFSVLVVPDALPRTKPKALDFALPLCQGEFLVVFDAEDRPEPQQLRQVVAQFERDPDLSCIQARLVIDNGNEGFLPALFAGEYAGLFAVLLPALAHWGLVMPLGGTSNHFRTRTLRQLGGWDAFNVTEDADLGVRLARRGLRCATSTACTYEVAPSRLRPWLGQRTRWMKGWMQTYVVHNRRPSRLLADLGWRGTIMFHVILLGMLLAPLLHAGFLFSVAALAAMGQLSWPQMQIWPIACLVILVLGHGVAIATNLVGLARTGQHSLRLWQMLLPAYWIMICVATMLALHEFTLRPFHWFKSPHIANGEKFQPASRAGDVVSETAGNSDHRRGRKAIWDRSPAG